LAPQPVPQAPPERLQSRDGRLAVKPGSPMGQKDFRILDPAGYYLRITDRAG
jgi:hypothetical protein